MSSAEGPLSSAEGPLSSAEGPLVVIGVGNVLLRDDGVGVRVIEGLRAMVERDPNALPTGTRLVDGGTLGIDLLRTVRGARGLVLVDAVRLGGSPGAVTVLHGVGLDAAGGPRDGTAPGAIGELLATARLMGALPGPLALVGVEAAAIELGLHLSEAVNGALAAAMDAVRCELRRMDVFAPAYSEGGGATAHLAGATA